MRESKSSRRHPGRPRALYARWAFPCAFALAALAPGEAFSAPDAAGQDELAELLDPLGDEAGAEEAFFLLEEQVVTTASKKKEKMGRAPAIMSVVTADEIAHMGAKTYLDVLQRVPGLGVSITNFGQFIITVRGIRTTGTEKVLLLIDGHSVNDSFIGSGLTFFDDLPVENIQRIEIIRGPGSALYGANAFAGVVNIITKKGGDIDGGQVSAGFGSYNTGTGDVLIGKKFDNGLEASAYFHYWKSDGMDETVDADLQTILDRFRGSDASLAPGPTTFEREKLLIDVNLSYEGIRSKSLFGFRDREDYIGLSLSLNDESLLREIQLFQEFGYRFEIFDEERLVSDSKVYFDLFNEDILFNQFPPGHVQIGGFDGDGVFDVFPDGRKSQIELSNMKIGFEQQFDLELFPGNNLTAGIVYEHIRQFDVRSRNNQDRLTGDPLPDLIDVTDLDNFNRNVARDLFALYAQDVWNVTEDLGITLGLRYDRYSDFGDTINPRAGLVWNFTDKGTLKLLYGRAFRAPNFRELYDFLGSEGLKAETIDSYEVELGYRFTDFLKARVNYFYNDLDDVIVEDTTSFPFFFKNSGQAEVHGIEAEVVFASTQGSYAYVNYSYAHPEDGDGNPLPDVPFHTANLGLNLAAFDRVNWNTNLMYVGQRERGAGDSREDLDDFIRVDTTLGVDLVDTVNVSASLYNVFDTDVREPAPSAIPRDFPMPGRTFFFRVRFSF
ncbi:MAG: TonB-dependent receptor plug domain-containing protein [Planctomycetota bacterium]|jgi:iron complex outermembrane receptor protein